MKTDLIKLRHMVDATTEIIDFSTDNLCGQISEAWILVAQIKVQPNYFGASTSSKLS